MSVKGPRLHHMVVIAERPGKRVALALAILLLCVGIAAAAFVAGRVLTLRALAGDSGSDNTMASLESLIERNTALRDELAVYRGGGDVAREVEERVRTENRGLQDRVAELEQALADYRRLVVTDASGKGLGIEKLELAKSSVPGTWLLRVVLVRLGERDSVVDGELNGQLITEDAAGARTTLPLSQLVGPDRRTFQVRYVEERMIDLHLAPGQTPVRLDLSAGIAAPQVGRVDKSWQRPPSAVRKAVPATEAVKPQEVPGHDG